MSTLRSTYSRDTSLISGPRIFYSATGGVFRRIFWPMPLMQKCGNFCRRPAAVQVALIGAHDEMPSVAATQTFIYLRMELMGTAT